MFGARKVVGLVGPQRGFLAKLGFGEIVAGLRSSSSEGPSGHDLEAPMRPSAPLLELASHGGRQVSMPPAITLASERHCFARVSTLTPYGASALPLVPHPLFTDNRKIPFRKNPVHDLHHRVVQCSGGCETR